MLGPFCIHLPLSRHTQRYFDLFTHSEKTPLIIVHVCALAKQECTVHTESGSDRLDRWPDQLDRRTSTMYISCVDTHCAGLTRQRLYLVRSKV